jgi:cytochrome c
MIKVMPASLLVAAFLAAALLLSAGGQAQSSAPAPAANDGAKLYQAKCGGCHSIAANKIGPAHKGVFGRKAAMVAGYKYSPALRAAKVTWDAKTLDQWLQGPQKLVKGSRMYLAVPDPAQRAAIITYLQSDPVR